VRVSVAELVFGCCGQVVNVADICFPPSVVDSGVVCWPCRRLLLLLSDDALTFVWNAATTVVSAIRRVSADISSSSEPPCLCHAKHLLAEIRLDLIINSKKCDSPVSAFADFIGARLL
jgi:hypothetical protein